MSRTSLVSVTACAMCPAAAPTERDLALAGGGDPAGHGYHVALHTPSVLTGPEDYHPTALLTAAGSGDTDGGPPLARHGLIPGSRSHTTRGEGRSHGAPPTGAVINDADTWRAPEYIRIPGERCSYRPWTPSRATTGRSAAGGDVLEAAAAVSSAHLRDIVASATGSPSVVRQFTAAPAPASVSPARVLSAGREHRPPVSAPAEPRATSRHGLVRVGPSVLRYAAGGVLLLVIAGALARRRTATCRCSV
ncbi:hypothetical protein [Streptomyces sp. NBC_00859]|uniref:hypothetical protein n=1 Tax=Streptomyces sp. NBC_00859 TaxID=2903682 RepID=UPI00386B018A|nr:hypothetical protein OG584_07330 [Streptomyces sp. NBC_00859]